MHSGFNVGRYYKEKKRDWVVVELNSTEQHTFLITGIEIGS